MANMRNLLTDVDGLRVGHAHDEALRSGVTVVIGDAPFTAAVDIRGGAPGSRDTAPLMPGSTINQAHAIVLSGGSAFGLNAAGGVQSYLRQHNIGFEIGDVRVPVVPQAILFDLLNGGDKSWGDRPPYEDMARNACDSAGQDFMLGSVGAGYGAQTALFKGGIGSASARATNGHTVGALVAVNPVGCVTVPGTPYFWAAPFERDNEFGGHGMPPHFTADMLKLVMKSSRPENTTLAIVATDATLTKMQAFRLAVMAQTGLAMAIRPVHTPLDGDIVFAVSTSKRPLGDPLADLTLLGAETAQVLARAVARAVYEAHCFAGAWPEPPAYREAFP